MEPQRPLENAPGAVSALVFGILGLVLCPIFAPFAWGYGAQAEKAARYGRYSGEGLATAGKILGIIGTVILVIGIIFVIGIIASGGSLEPGAVQGWSSGGR